MVVVQSEKVVLDEQEEVEDEDDELCVDEDELSVEDSELDEELWFSSSLSLFSMSVTMLLISSRYSDPFLISFSMSSVTSSGTSGISLIMSLATGSMQLMAASAISLAVSTVASAASEARFPTALKRDLLRLDPEQGDLLESKLVLER